METIVYDEPGDGLLARGQCDSGARLPWQRRYQALAKANADVNSTNRFGLLGELLLAQVRPCIGQ
jgi:hypothetical protein